MKGGCTVFYAVSLPVWHAVSALTVVRCSVGWGVSSCTKFPTVLSGQTPVYLLHSVQVLASWSLLVVWSDDRSQPVKDFMGWGSQEEAWSCAVHVERPVSLLKVNVCHHEGAGLEHTLFLFNGV